MRLIWIDLVHGKPVAHIGSETLDEPIEIIIRRTEPTVIKIGGERVTEMTRVVYRGTLIAWDEGAAS